jgi:hypothetical protein
MTAVAILSQRPLVKIGMTTGAVPVRLQKFSARMALDASDSGVDGEDPFVRMVKGNRPERFPSLVALFALSFQARFVRRLMAALTCGRRLLCPVAVAGFAGEFPMTPGQGKSGARMILDLLGFELRFPAAALGSAGRDAPRTAGGEEHSQDEKNQRKPSEGREAPPSIGPLSENRWNHLIVTSATARPFIPVALEAGRFSVLSPLEIRAMAGDAILQGLAIPVGMPGAIQHDGMGQLGTSGRARVSGPERVIDRITSLLEGEKTCEQNDGEKSRQTASGSDVFGNLHCPKC